MSAIKTFFENEIERLAKLTGYTWGQLMDIWNEMLEDGEDDWDTFVAITLELDW